LDVLCSLPFAHPYPDAAQATVVVQAWQPVSCIVSTPAVPVTALPTEAEARAAPSSSSSSDGTTVLVGVLGALAAVAAVVVVVVAVRMRRQPSLAHAPLINVDQQ
jgi:hypothetical protein